MSDIPKGDYECLCCGRWLTARRWPKSWEPFEVVDGLHYGTCPDCCRVLADALGQVSPQAEGTA